MADADADSARQTHLDARSRALELLNALRRDGDALQGSAFEGGATVYVDAASSVRRFLDELEASLDGGVTRPADRLTAEGSGASNPSNERPHS